MKSRTSRVLCLFLIVAAVSTAATASQIAGPQAPRTVAEATDYGATSRYADVMAFIRDLQRLSPLVRVETLCTSAEGRDVPLLVVGKPVPASPNALSSDPRIVVYIQANIHAGEVEGKEASLMLVRDIVLDPGAPYLDKIVLIPMGFNRRLPSLSI